MRPKRNVRAKILLACLVIMPVAAFICRRQMFVSISSQHLGLASRSRLRPISNVSLRQSRLYSATNTVNDKEIGSSCKNKPSRFISYLTDVEGDRDYLARYVEQSRVLQFRPMDPAAATHHDDDANTHNSFPYDHYIDFINDDDMLVYGGDAWDQGGSDLYVIRQLLDLKERHADRVHLVVGNRDVNKMRMVRELGGMNDIAAPPHPGVYWLKGSGRQGDPSCGELLSDDPVQRLQWMLRDTMGSPRAFEHRRLELERERSEKGQTDEVLDLDVVDSYKRSTEPAEGEMSRYLSQAELAVKLGDILFVHGGLPLTQAVVDAHGDSKESIWKDMTFAMPWLPSGKLARCDTMYEWFSRLNYFLHDSVDAWKEIDAQADDPFWAVSGGYRPFPSYSNLVQYGMGGLPGGRGNNPTIIYQSWATDGMPRRFFDKDESNRNFVKHVRDFFQRADLKLIMSGHQPQGDMPNTIRVDIPGQTSPAFIVCSDTSYSGDTKWHNLSSDAFQRQNLGRGTARSGRGNIAVTEVLIEQSKRTSRVVDVVSHGTLSDGTNFETRGLFQNEPTELVVGQVASRGLVPTPLDDSLGPWWTRAAFTDGSYLLSTGKGFDCWNRIVEPK